MSDISPEAQALIDRLARMGAANPRQDKAIIERAITAHLHALELPARPFTWADDIQSAFQIILQRADPDTTYKSEGHDPDWHDARWGLLKGLGNASVPTAAIGSIRDVLAASESLSWESLARAMWNYEGQRRAGQS